MVERIHRHFIWKNQDPPFVISPVWRLIKSFKNSCTKIRWYIPPLLIWIYLSTNYQTWFLSTRVFTAKYFWIDFKFVHCYFLLAYLISQEDIFACFMKNGYPVTNFAGIKNPISVDAEGLTNILNDTKSLNPSDQDSEEYLEKVFKHLVSVNFDGASFMSGHISGIQSRLEKHRDELLYTHTLPIF